MSNNYVKYEVFVKQYLRAILDISVSDCVRIDKAFVIVAVGWEKESFKEKRGENGEDSTKVMKMKLNVSNSLLSGA